MEFVDCLVTQFLVVLSLAGKLDLQYRLERLLNGLKANQKYLQEANVLELYLIKLWIRFLANYGPMIVLRVISERSPRMLLLLL